MPFLHISIPTRFSQKSSVISKCTDFWRVTVRITAIFLPNHFLIFFCHCYKNAHNKSINLYTFLISLTKTPSVLYHVSNISTFSFFYFFLIFLTSTEAALSMFKQWFSCFPTVMTFGCLAFILLFSRHGEILKQLYILFFHYSNWFSAIPIFCSLQVCLGLRPDHVEIVILIRSPKLENVETGQ